MPLRSNRSSLAFTLAIVLTTAGCRPDPAVESYTVKRTAPPRPQINAELLRSQFDHILVAIVPDGDKAWFFKLVGKAAAIERQRPSFSEFLASVEMPDPSSKIPTWTLPEGWQEQQEAVAMRDATLLVPDADGELQLAVSSLPLSIEWEEFLVPNVNRWLNQLKRRPLSKETVLKLAQSKTTKGGEATVFELSGTMTQRRMGADPHAGLDMASKPAPTSATPGARNELTYETPEGWLPGQKSSMRKAAFLLPGGNSTDLVTVTSFPDAAQMADVTANVQRWAGQVGLNLADPAAVEKVTESISIDGINGTYVELTGSGEPAQANAIYAAMIKRKGQIWFFKMSGKSELVSSQRSAFREFLSSVALP